MTEKSNGGSPEKEPERPLECTECRRPIAVYYTEIVGDIVMRSCMCSECPVLQRRLRGSPHLEHPGEKSEGASLACGNCGTTLDSIRLGTPLGCSVCYEVFDDILLPEMLAAEKIPQRLATNKRSVPIHIGRGPGEVQEMSPSLRILALNEALNETLKKEDYEQAAWLRDQIKELTEKQSGSSSQNHGEKPHGK